MIGDAAAVITAITGLVAALGVIILGVMQIKTGGKINRVGESTRNTEAAVTTGNGHTLAENVQGIADVTGATPTEIMPKES